MKHKHSEQEIRHAVSNSTNICQLLHLLGMPAKGGNYKTIQRRLTSLNIDTTHFTGQGWSRGKILGPKTSTESYLDNTIPISSFRLKNRLIEEGIFHHQCSNCLQTEWLGSPIPLELDHIDGNSDDNRLANIRLLCPNCHAMTPTYRGRNKNRFEV